MDGVDPPRDRPDDRDHRRRGPHPHRGRDRRARALHLPADRRRGGRGRDDDADRRRHRPGRGHARDDLHAVAVGDPRDADRDGPTAGQRAAAGQGQHGVAARACGAGRAGVGGFKLHEDWGSTPAAIDACLRIADETGVQVAIHTDTLNEAGYVQSTLARSAAARSTPTTPRARAAGTRRTSSRSPRSPTCCRARPTRRARTRSTPSTSTSTC